MNSIKKFMDIFESKRLSSSWVEMASILKECAQYFKNVPASERGVILSILLNERNGLLTFLMNCLNQPHISKDLEKAMIQTLHLLIPILKQFSEDYKPYIKSTMAVLKVALTIKTTCFLMDAAGETFAQFLQVFKSTDLDLDSLVRDWVKKLHLYTIEERRILLYVMSVIARHFPQTAAFKLFAKVIVGRLMADYSETYKGTKKRVQCLVLYIETLSNILQNFPPSCDDTGSSGLISIYGNLKKLCNSKENQNTEKLMIAAINLLSEHMTLFDEYVYEDYQLWSLLLSSFVRKGIYGDVAIETLRNYYKTLGTVFGRKNSPDDKKVFLNLRASFVRSLENDRISSTELRLTVYGFSQIIEPCKNHLPSAGDEEIFSLIVHRTIPLFSREDDETTRYEEISDYLVALSRIIRFLENVSIDQMRALATLCTLMIKHFPELTMAEQQYAITCLNTTIINVRYTKETLYQDFIANIIYEGIIWSCSHTLLIDAELQRDTDEQRMSQHLITCKDYVPLWCGLLNPENYAGLSEIGETHVAVLRTVVDEIVSTCVRLVSTLNLDVTSSNEYSASQDPTFSRIPANKADFRIFLNLVDLYVEILPCIESDLWFDLDDKLIREIIKNSYKSPSISGFYKLANATLTSSSIFSRHNTSNSDSYDLVLQYLWSIIASLPRYPQELQKSCLHLVLNAPESFVPRIADRAIPAFQIALALGLTNYEMASTALAALERWHECPGFENPGNFISGIVPDLAAFLQNEESSERLIQDIEENRQRGLGRWNRGGRRGNVITFVDDECTVEAFQKRILLFLGSLDYEVTSNYIHERSMKTGATWGEKNLLNYPMPFPDASLDVHLDCMIPRIIKLAQSAGDRRTRIAACEVLHTVVAFVLGKTVHSLTYDKDRYAKIYEILYPALLKLSCDPDDVIMQIFHPLTMQVTHWASSTLMLDSLSTKHLVNTLFEGLSDEINSSLRDLSGVYLAEFVLWSIRQSSDRSLTESSTNIHFILRRIVDFALDPSPGKRVAAAIAFNHLYRIIRENDEIVDIFWLTILHAFVSSLEGCCDTRIDDSLKHVQRVLNEKSRMFTEVNPRRDHPPGFDGSTIVGALNWILQQCGSLDRYCRSKCMDIFVNLSSNTASNEINSPKDAIEVFLKRRNMRGLNDILIGDKGDESQALAGLQRSLDLYVWLIRDKLIDNKILFGEDNPDRRVIFDRVDSLVCDCLAIADTGNAADNESSKNLREFVTSRTLRCETILILFDFVLLLLDVRAMEPHHVPDDVFNGKFFSLVACCLTKPERLSFDSSNLQLTEQLPTKLKHLLNKLMEILSSQLACQMRDVLALEIGRFSERLFDFDGVKESRSSLPSENYVRGLVMLQKSGILKMCRNCDSITANASEKVAKISDLLRSEEFGKSVCFYLKSETRNYLENLIELLLMDYHPDNMKSIIQLLNATKQLNRSDMTVVTHGEYFFSTFRNVLIRGFLRNFECTLNLLEDSIKQNPDHVLRTVEAIVLHLQHDRNEYRPILESCASMLIAKFPVFKSSVNNLKYRRNVLLNIYAIAVRLRRDKLLERDSELYGWLLRELVDSSDFKYKIRLLEDFLVCLVDETLQDRPELAAILANLRNDRKIRNPEDANTNQVGATVMTISYFQVFLKLLPVTRSTIVLDAIISFSSDADAAFCDGRIAEYLKKYYAALGTTASALKSLEMTYERFARLTSLSERLNVLRYILLPSLNECDASTIEDFFERKMPELYAIIMEKPTTNIQDRQQLFVSKIAAYNLMEIMFAIVPRERIDSRECSIAIATRAIDENSANTNSDKKCTQKIFLGTIQIRQLRAISGDDGEIVRRVHCAAYKCCITIISTTREEKFYLAAFAENRDKDHIIWENIVDVDRKYDFRQTSKEYPKEREALVNIRKHESSRKNTPDDHYSYIKSYDLATSTLNEDICAYDLNAVNLIEQGKNEELAFKNAVISLKLEVDDLNEHECMPHICGFLKHIRETEISSRPCNDHTALPKWMVQFRASMWSKRSNVRLFLLKVVLNCQQVFRPYAKFFLESVINTVYRCITENDALGYAVTDALIMLVDWSEIAIPNTEREHSLARLMLASLIEKSVTAPTQLIIKYNTSIIEMIVDSWHEFLNVPESLDNRIARDDRTVIKLVLIFLTKKMADKIIARDDIWRYIVKCLSDWKIKETTVLQCYEAAGLILKSSAGQYESRKNEIIEMLPVVFRAMQISHPSRLIKCIHAMCKACDSLANDFWQFVSFIQLRVEPINIVKCLEVFSLVVPSLSKENVIKELSYMRFSNLLENKVVACEGTCLRIIEQLIGILETEQLLDLAKLIVPYSSHDIFEYRQLCFQIFAKLYKTYSAVESKDKKEIIDISRKVLLSGILDPADEIQKSSFAFWSDVTAGQDELFQKCLDILDTYSCGIESNFLQIVTLLLLELTRKTVGCEKEMFEPFHNRTYNDHEISISWKTRNYESRIPLYAPSLAKQLNQRFTQYSYAVGTSSFNNRDSQENYVLRATEAPQFEPTASFSINDPVHENEIDDSTENVTFAMPRIPELPRNKVSQRFLEDRPGISVKKKKKEELNRSLELAYRRDYLARQQGRVKLRRKYRIGDFPDIAISHLTLLGPVQELVKRDLQICRDLLVNMVGSLFSRSMNKRGTGRCQAEIITKFAQILSDGRKNSDAVAAILEMLFQVPDLEYPWSMVVQVAKNYGFHAQGAYLTEQSLARQLPVSPLEPPTKKPRTLRSKNELEKQKWIELAGLYESMNEFDVVLGIFRGDSFTEDLHTASLARATNDWMRAEECYRKALESEIDEQMKQHSLRGNFECLARLGKWKKLEKDINARINNNFENLLTPDPDESRWMAPWIFRTHTQRIVESHGNEKFLTAMCVFLNGTASYQLLKEHYGEETAIILSTEKPEVSRDFLNSSWETVRQRWLRSSALAVPPKTESMLKMRGIHDIDRYLRAIAASPDIAESWRELNKRWNNSVPSNKDDLLAWDVHTSYRLYFCGSFIKALSTNQSQETIALIDDIRISEIRQMLKLIGCSLSQKNSQLAKRYMLRVESKLTHCYDQSLVDEFEINAVRFKFLEAQMSDDPAASLKQYCSIWELSHKILGADSLLVQSAIAIRQVVSEVSSHLAKIANEKEDFIRELMARTKLAENIFSERIDFDNVGESLSYYSFTNLQECCNLAPDVADCHLRLSKYCYESISFGNCNGQVSREFVVSTLRAMAHGSDEASYYFPCLLKDNILSYDEARRAFTNESINVETWRFLVWQTQLLAQLGTSTGDIVMPIVERLIKVYPHAMVYSVRLALDTSVKLRDLSSEILQLQSFLAGKQNYDKFLQAMEYVVSPSLFVEYYLEEFARNVSTDRKKAYTRLLEKLYPTATKDTLLQGNLLRDIVTSCKSEIEGMLEKPITEVRSLVDVLLHRLRKTASNRRERNELKFYSPWLCEYTGRDIEVPGQYNVNEKPKPSYHAKIVKVDSTIKVMQSLRKPLKITILATDGRSYRFLVKFGEDLRLDQRIEQVFGVMNDKLKTDAVCAQRRLSIDTYQVFPLSGSFGLIQWIDDTKTLQEYINFSMNVTEKNRHGQVATAYNEWIGKAAPGKSRSVQHEEAILKYRADDVRDKLTEFTRSIRGDTLRNTFVKLSTCLESFVSLRRNFTTTYATMCLGQWILGIGDRHLANTLLKVESGRCLGIDFASAFGGGIDQSVPELVPFRLTAQIKGIFVPFNEYDAMGATMIHVLRALKNNSGSLLASLDVVAHEQLNWQDHIHHLSQERDITTTDTTWLPERKVRIVAKKLDGGKPSSITLEQLAERHSDEKYFPRYVAIVSGTDSGHDCKRKSYKEYNLSPEEQVQCLIEQATDSNLLGRIHVGWAPWL